MHGLSAVYHLSLPKLSFGSNGVFNSIDQTVKWVAWSWLITHKSGKAERFACLVTGLSVVTNAIMINIVNILIQ